MSEEVTPAITTGQGKVLTVSIAAYNVEGYLGEALESCVVRNMDLLEVIVVDDGSRDGTAAVARGYVGRYPGTFKLISKENGGYGSTVNKSLMLAQGKYFRYLDGDDWFDRAGLESYLDLLSTCTEDAVFAPYARHYDADGSEEEIDDLQGVPEGALNLRGWGGSRAIAGCSLAYKTALLRRIGFEMLEHCFYTDVQFAYEPIAFADTLRVSKTSVYRYRIGRAGQSVSREGISKHYGDIVRVNARILSSLVDSTTGKAVNGVTCEPYVWHVLTKEAAVAYRIICTAYPSREALDCLRGFDAFLRGYPRLYRDTASYSKSVRLLRFSGFLLYRPLCAFAAREAVR